PVRLDEELPGHHVAKVVELDVPGPAQAHRPLHPDRPEVQVAYAALVGHGDLDGRAVAAAPTATHSRPSSIRLTRRTKPAGSSSCPPSASRACWKKSIAQS